MLSKRDDYFSPSFDTFYVIIVCCENFYVRFCVQERNRRFLALAAFITRLLVCLKPPDISFLSACQDGGIVNKV